MGPTKSRGSHIHLVDPMWILTNQRECVDRCVLKCVLLAFRTYSLVRVIPSLTHSTNVQPPQQLFQCSWPVTCYLPFNTLLIFLIVEFQTVTHYRWEEQSSYTYLFFLEWPLVLIWTCERWYASNFFSKIFIPETINKVKLHSLKKMKINFHGVSKNSSVFMPKPPPLHWIFNFSPLL